MVPQLDSAGKKGAQKYSAVIDLKKFKSLKDGFSWIRLKIVQIWDSTIVVIQNKLMEFLVSIVWRNFVQCASLKAKLF